MAGSGTYSIQIGEHGILLAAAHLSVRFVNNDTGKRIVEFNGLATKRGTEYTNSLGVPWRDDILGHEWVEGVDGDSYWNSTRTRSTDTIATKPLDALETDLAIARAVIEAVNAKGITYNPIGYNSNNFAFDLLEAFGYSRADVRAITDRLTPGARLDLLTDQEIRDIRDSILGNVREEPSAYEATGNTFHNGGTVGDFSDDMWIIDGESPLAYSTAC
ncbi:hypothetical protein [Cognatiyoonia sp. IB215182]|uniref:hypothetical protein n=1 Tax=Cognatiyoonia sp. IB215182 TaxID=3097353 RepID=UPI002A0F9DE9|nr:hypothetical protein [Cognatiyoonia sp. IB215182]MDX8355524.1 hypothetical protein [Cognatiyoonia sp. IB215182]